MADGGAQGDKSEKPSEQRLRKAREQGQVARSKALPLAVGVLLSLKLLQLFMPHYLAGFRSLFELSFAVLDTDGAQDNVWSNAFINTLALTGQLLAPLAVLPAVLLLASVVPGGLVFSTKHWMPDFQRLRPGAHLGRLFSARQLTELGTSLGKVACLLVALVYVVRGQSAQFVALQGQTLDEALLHGASLTLDALLVMASILLVFALVDAPLQYLFFLRSQRMTKQEVKEEHKQQEGRPEVRNRIRQLRLAMAKRGARQTVPQADVVVVNPTHYAVALRYDEARAEAPFVVAKGVDEMALYIREIARQHQVQVLTLAPLARAVYNSSQVHQQIPASLYEAVAHVLGYVMQLKAFESGRRRTLPTLPTDLDVPRHLSDPDT